MNTSLTPEQYIDRLTVIHKQSKDMAEFVMSVIHGDVLNIKTSFEAEVLWRLIGRTYA